MTDEEHAKLKEYAMRWKETGEIMEKLHLEARQKSFDVLTDLRGVWIATPLLYSSLRYLKFNTENNAELGYGYGQTIYAVIKTKFDVKESNILSLSYLESPSRSSFKGFFPSSENRRKELFFTLTNETFNFGEQIGDRIQTFQWKLKFEHSPFPEGLQFPYDVPLEYYGHQITK